MGEPDDHAVEILRDALERSDDPIRVNISMSRATARKVLHLFEAEHASGAVVVPVKDLYTTTESASLLGISRASLMKLIESGEIEPVMVGSHHRVPVAELHAYQQARQVSRERAAELMDGFASSRFQTNVRFGAMRRRTVGNSEEGFDPSEH